MYTVVVPRHRAAVKLPHPSCRRNPAAAVMLPPSHCRCCVVAIALPPSRCHYSQASAAAATTAPSWHRSTSATAATAKLPPLPPRCRHTTKQLLPPPPSCHHCHRRLRHCHMLSPPATAATTAALPPPYCRRCRASDAAKLLPPRVLCVRVCFFPLIVKEDPQTLRPVEIGTFSTNLHAHMPKINSSYVKILQNSCKAPAKFPQLGLK